MSLKSIIKYFLLWQVLITLVVVVAGNLLPLRYSDTFLGGGAASYLKNPLLNFRSNFDGVMYSLIATHGYNYGQQAYFPLYPVLIKSVKVYVDDPILIGFLISSVSFVAALIILNRLIRLDYSPQVAKWTILALLIFPTSFFFSAVYTESLFLLLVVLSFYLVRTRHPWLACLVAALAGYTRLVGIFLLPALFFEFLSQNRGFPPLNLLKKLTPLLLVPLGLLLYMNYLYRTTGDPLIFYTLQSSFKQGRSAEIVLPYQVLWRYIKMVGTVNRADPLYLTVWLEFVTGIIFTTLGLISLFKQRLSYAIFNLFAFMLPTLTGIFTSLPRYVLVCFPAFIIIGEFFASKPKIGKIILALSALLWVVYLSLFARGYWVA